MVKLFWLKMVHSFLILQLVADFASVTRIEDPMQVLKDNWIIWMPKISQKVKIESETHRKTYLPFLHILSECREKSAEEICERKP